MYGKVGCWVRSPQPELDRSRHWFAAFDAEGGRQIEDDIAAGRLETKPWRTCERAFSARAEQVDWNHVSAIP